MKNLRWREMGWAVAFAVLLLVLYSGVYFSTVRRTYTHAPRQVHAVYRAFDIDLPPSLFAPVNAVDRQLRPGYWDWSAGIGRVAGPPEATGK